MKSIWNRILELKGYGDLPLLHAGPAVIAMMSAAASNGDGR